MWSWAPFPRKLEADRCKVQSGEDPGWRGGGVCSAGLLCRDVALVIIWERCFQTAVLQLVCCLSDGTVVGEKLSLSAATPGSLPYTSFPLEALSLSCGSILHIHYRG